MARQRGYPDRRGMGAQSDFLAETFRPSDEHQRAQILRAQALVRTGIPLAEVARMLSLPIAWLSANRGDNSAQS